MAASKVHEMGGPLLDAQGAAKLLNVPASWVLSEARANRIPHVRLGRYVRFEGAELLEWCRARQRGPSHGVRKAADSGRIGSGKSSAPAPLGTAGGMAPGG